jgi:molybdopterin synthase sulfur carrier subunit
MMVKIRCFAQLREIVGASELVRAVSAGATVATVWQQVVAEYPAAAIVRTALAVAVNAEFARFSTPVCEGDEVAFLPPVSGG